MDTSREDKNPRYPAGSPGRSEGIVRPRTMGLRMLGLGFVMGLAVSTILMSTQQQATQYPQVSGIDIDLAAAGLLPPNRRDCGCNSTLREGKTTTNASDLDPTPGQVGASVDATTGIDGSTISTEKSRGGAGFLSNTQDAPASKPVSVSSNPSMLVSAPQDGSEDILEFDPEAPVVIATKIQSTKTIKILSNSLCLLHYAYNRRVNYDIVVFTATPIPEDQLTLLRSTVAPANLTLVVDNPGIQPMVDVLSEDLKQHLLERCNVTNSSELTWETRCYEEASNTNMPIQYNWQAEFRSLHIWKEPILAKYKYMIWLDTDAYCTKSWEKDPIAEMRKNDLVLLFDHFPAGRAKGPEWAPRMREAFGQVFSDIRQRNGTLVALPGKWKRRSYLRQVYGFFHITNLDFYRSEPVMNWQRIMIGNTKFSRQFDDQIAVTMPAAVLAGNRSWHMRHFGMNMGVLHQRAMDGRKNEKVESARAFLKEHGQERFPEAVGKCELTNLGR